MTGNYMFLLSADRIIVTIVTIAMVVIFAVFLAIFLIQDYRNTKVADIREKLYKNAQRQPKYEVNTVYADKSKNYSGTEILPVPKKESTREFTFEFAGWDKNYFNEAGDTIAKAIYIKKVNNVVVNFYDSDRVTLLKTFTVNYGAGITLGNFLPKKQDTNQFSFEFIGWSGDMSAFYEDTNLYAVYRAIPKVYTYTFFDYDKRTVILTGTGEYGAFIPEPDTSGMRRFGHTFSHFEKYYKGILLTKNMDFYAVYNTIDESQFFENFDGKKESENFDGKKEGENFDEKKESESLLDDKPKVENDGKDQGLDLKENSGNDAQTQETEINSESEGKVGENQVNATDEKAEEQLLKDKSNFETEVLDFTAVEAEVKDKEAKDDFENADFEEKRDSQGNRFVKNDDRVIVSRSHTMFNDIKFNDVKEDFPEDKDGVLIQPDDFTGKTADSYSENYAGRDNMARGDVSFKASKALENLISQEIHYDIPKKTEKKKETEKKPKKVEKVTVKKDGATIEIIKDDFDNKKERKPRTKKTGTVYGGDFSNEKINITMNNTKRKKKLEEDAEKEKKEREDEFLIPNISVMKASIKTNKARERTMMASQNVTIDRTQRVIKLYEKNATSEVEEKKDEVFDFPVAILVGHRNKK